MGRNTICDVETSSALNERLGDDETLIKELNENEFVTHNSNINMVVSKNNSVNSFFGLDPRYGQKLFLLSQDQHEVQLQSTPDIQKRLRIRYQSKNKVSV